MWKQPWGYTEGWAISGGLFATGMILQLSVGKVDASALSSPAGFIAGGLFLLLLVALHLIARRVILLRWFAGHVAGITAVSSLLVLVIVMGLTRQVSPVHDIPDGGVVARMGFMQMTVAWTFVLLFLYVLMVLGLVLLRRISRFRWKDTGFVLNHAGLFIVLFASAFGSGDLQKLRMTATLSAAEWRATDECNKTVELPLAVELKSFTIDEYPPKLMLIDNNTGETLPLGRPASVSVEACPSVLELAGWELEITKYLPSAAAFINQDTTIFTEFNMEGATSALYIKARHTNDGTQREGWISCGSYMFPYSSLHLDDDVSLVMPFREPRRFASDVIVYTKSGDTREALIEVNKPMSVAGWKIYLLSYDEAMGKWSRSSVFELVKDPWLPAVYAGIFMMLAGAVFLFLSAPEKKV